MGAQEPYVLPFLITSEDWAQTAYTGSMSGVGARHQHLALYEGGDIVSVTLFECKGHTRFDVPSLR